MASPIYVIVNSSFKNIGANTSWKARFRSSESILIKLFQSTCRRSGVMITRVQFSEGPPTKIWGRKNVQNSAQFLTTFEFDREYLWNGSSCPKSEKNNYNPFHVGPKKFGELWSTNNRVKLAHIDPPKWIFFGRLHFGHWGCCPLKFVHALEIDPGYLAHNLTGTGVPQKNF